MSKSVGPFSGTHLTIMAVFAMLIPTAIWGAANYSNVVIQNTAGKTVDVSGGNLRVQDVLQDYAADPKNLVTIFLHNTQGMTCTSYYTVPTGKALIIKSASINFFDNSAGNYEEFDLYANNCQNLFMSISTSSTPSNSVQFFGGGVPVPSGSNIMGYVASGGGNPGAFGFLYGYLVPASALPQMSTADAAAQFGGEPGPSGRARR